MRVAAIVVAGGRGVRFGGPKQFLHLGDATVAAASVAAARSVASYVVLVVPDTYQGGGEGADLVVVGGETRADSVRSALGHLSEADFIVVHDAARPLASTALFTRVVSALTDGVDGVVPALEITDTVKQVRERNGRREVSATLNRGELVSVQTPQAFRATVLRRAHQDAREATDDASLVEALGATVVVVQGERENVKITEPGDYEALQKALAS